VELVLWLRPLGEKCSGTGCRHRYWSSLPHQKTRRDEYLPVPLREEKNTTTLTMSNLHTCLIVQIVHDEGAYRP
jgi:hypothetical protein